MYFALILFLIIAIIAVIFGVQNTAVVTLKLFGFKLESSLALILLVFMGIGVILTLLFSIPYFLKNKKRISSLNKRVKELEKTLSDLEEKNKTLVGKSEEAENEVNNI